MTSDICDITRDIWMELSMNNRSISLSLSAWGRQLRSQVPLGVVQINSAPWLNQIFPSASGSFICHVSPNSAAPSPSWCKTSCRIGCFDPQKAWLFGPFWPTYHCFSKDGDVFFGSEDNVVLTDDFIQDVVDPQPEWSPLIPTQLVKWRWPNVEATSDGASRITAYHHDDDNRYELWTT